MQYSTQGCGKLRISHRVGRRSIDWTRNIRVTQAVHDHSDNIRNMDPGHPLLAITNGATKSQLKWRQHFLQRTTMPQHYASAQINQPSPQRLKWRRTLFPTTAQLMGEVILRWRGFIHWLIIAIAGAIETNSRTAYHHLGALGSVGKKSV